MEYKCDRCDGKMKTQAQLEFHYKSKKHAKKDVKSTFYVHPKCHMYLDIGKHTTSIKYILHK
jgi:hypothetical protein